MSFNPDSTAYEVAEWLNKQNADIDKAINQLNQDEPEWFDFDDFYDNTPIAGFHRNKAILLANTNKHFKDLKWVVIDSDTQTDWRKE